MSSTIEITHDTTGDPKNPGWLVRSAGGDWEQDAVTDDHDGDPNAARDVALALVATRPGITAVDWLRWEGDYGFRVWEARS